MGCVAHASGAGQIEFAERLHREHTGAVHRLAGDDVLLQNDHVEPGAAQQGRAVQASGPSANNDYVMHETS